MMIVTPDDQTKEIGLEVGPDEPPPIYSPSTEPISSGSANDDDPPTTITFKTKPTNFLSLSNNQDSIRGEFVIDPCMHIPSSMLPPLGDDETEQDRKNLCLGSKCGSVHAEIWLLGTSQAGADKDKPHLRTTVALTSNHGSIRAQLHTPDNATPFLLTANAPHGSVRIALPRFFQGLLAVSTRHGGIKLSDAFVQNATQLSQLGDTRRYFVGDIGLLGDEPWEGDQVEIQSTHGSIRVRYVDEGACQDGRRKKGLFSRLFGM